MGQQTCVFADLDLPSSLLSLTLLHSEGQKLYGVLALLGVIGLMN